MIDPARSRSRIAGRKNSQSDARKGLPEGVRFRLGGSADKLAATWNHMQLDLLLALIIVFLVMAVLSRVSFIPGSSCRRSGCGSGRSGRLALPNTYVTQSLDMLTMLGFVILMGLWSIMASCWCTRPSSTYAKTDGCEQRHRNRHA